MFHFSFSRTSYQGLYRKTNNLLSSVWNAYVAVFYFSEKRVQFEFFFCEKTSCQNQAFVLVARSLSCSIKNKSASILLFFEVFLITRLWAISGTRHRILPRCEGSEGSRVDLERPKMLNIQFHTLSLWKNASHTNFRHFCKMSLIEF